MTLLSSKAERRCVPENSSAGARYATREAVATTVTDWSTRNDTLSFDTPSAIRSRVRSNAHQGRSGIYGILPSSPYPPSDAGR